MGKKTGRAGGKFGGGHTTVIPAAGIIADIAHQCASVTKISPGFIKGGLSSVKGIKRLKITDDGGSILLSVRDNISHQELRIYTTDIQATRSCIAEGALKAGFKISN